jgi:hypothetical protein
MPMTDRPPASSATDHLLRAAILPDLVLPSAFGLHAGRIAAPPR